jgi:hypothetical protein
MWQKTLLKPVLKKPLDAVERYVKVNLKSPELKIGL